MIAIQQIIDQSRVVHGSLHQGFELNECLRILSGKNLRGFIEVGSANGASFYCWASLIDGPKISVDLNHGFGLSDGMAGANTLDDVPAATEETHPAVRDRNTKWRDHFTDVYTIEGNSMSPNTIAKVRTILDDQLVGWVFIDGWHEHFAALEDLKNYKQFLSSDGYIGFHDINQSDSMRNFWRDMTETYQNTITISAGNGIGIIPSTSITS